MTPVTEQPKPETATDLDLGETIHRVLQSSSEPMTLSKIRASLPARFRSVGLDELADLLRRQVAANVLWQYPKYRSKQDRYWDRPMAVHLAVLLRETLQARPLPWAELRRKLPAYALTHQPEEVLREQIGQGKLFIHPRMGRTRERIGKEPPDPKAYLRPALKSVFRGLQTLGFSRAQLQAGALEVLHDDEWADRPAAGAASDPAITDHPHCREAVEEGCQPPAGVFNRPHLPLETTAPLSSEAQH
jgi:hypothetical protein